MRSIRKSGVTALTAAIALSLGAVPVAFTAGILRGDEAPTTVTPAATIAYKTMVLETGSADRVFIDLDADGALDANEPTQGLQGSSKNCRLTSPSGSLLEFAGSFLGMTAGDNAASYSSDSLGVAEKKTGTSCYQVGSTTQEDLSLSLAAGLRGPTFPLLMNSASLDVELKQGARILATAFRGKDSSGKPIAVAYFDLAGGTVPEAELIDPKGLPYDYNRTCKPSADNGPDSTSGDKNCIWTLA